MAKRCQRYDRKIVAGKERYIARKRHEEKRAQDMMTNFQEWAFGADLDVKNAEGMVKDLKEELDARLGDN